MANVTGLRHIFLPDLTPIFRLILELSLSRDQGEHCEKQIRCTYVQSLRGNHPHTATAIKRKPHNEFDGMSHAPLKNSNLTGSREKWGATVARPR